MTVRAQDTWARVEVYDTGTEEWHPPEGEDLDAEYGRALAVIAALADKFGHDVSTTGQTFWAEVGWLVSRE